MTPTEALDIHANPDAHAGTRWREARAVLESAITSRGSLDIAIQAARGASGDYLGGYSGSELAAFQHGMGTIVTVLEALRDRPDDYQTRMCVAMGRDSQPIEVTHE
jgi:hypothetical protein